MNQERTLLRPVHVLDVAKALSCLPSLSPTPAFLSLPGPQVYSVEYLLQLVSSVTYRPASRTLRVSKSLAKLLARVSGLVWWPSLSPDQIERRYINDFAVESDWDVLELTPSTLEEHALTYLQMYRSS